ncbi:large ribosomal subunit protein bL27 [Neocloeon triangulifer]|uniref:large ribosomal subunit protein bL27 n=1 Tax=Neocloeon triangulifer TaxID=2078957 RepID=UPI00286F4587|nr:large ribosomal subunit protein bL27 [Neocloeon triangulifer]
MALLQNLLGKSNFLVGKLENLALPASIVARNASKKTGGSTKNQRGKTPIPKFRGLKKNEGVYVTAGTKVVTQRKLNYHPGLNVGLGKDGTLFAIEDGIVKITSEKCDLNMDHSWVQRIYGGKDITYLYKKYVHVLNQPQHNRFKLIDTI